MMCQECNNDSTLAVVLLDLSAGFDTIDHKILVDHVEDAGLHGSASDWIKSFLMELSQSAWLTHFRATEAHFDCRVPQGTSLSPHLFRQAYN